MKKSILSLIALGSLAFAPSAFADRVVCETGTDIYEVQHRLNDLVRSHEAIASISTSYSNGQALVCIVLVRR